MHRFLPCMFLILFLIACDKVDQAFETVDKVKTLKSDIEKTADQVKKDLTGRAEKIKNRALKEAGGLPYLNQSEKGRDSDEKKSERGESGEKD